MKQYRKSIFGILVGLASLTAAIAETVYAEDALKIGYVNATQIVSQAPQGNAAFQQLQSEFADRENQLRNMQTELTELEGRLADAVNLQMTQDQTNELEFQARSLRRELERQTTELNEDFNYRRNEELEKLQALISELILNIAKEEKYDLIVQSPVVWASDRINLTDEVLAILERMFNQ